MSLSEESKKAHEQYWLDLFLSSYNETTNRRLIHLETCERPDFICQWADGEEVGVELTRTPHDYHTRTHDAIWANVEMEMDYRDLFEAIHQMLNTKSAKIKESDWGASKTILVVFLESYTFDSLDWIDNAGVESDFLDYGFHEIWLADCSTIDAFNAVRLIGLHPPNLWGLVDQPSLEGKPFG